MFANIQSQPPLNRALNVVRISKRYLIDNEEFKINYYDEGFEANASSNAILIGSSSITSYMYNVQKPK